MTNDERAAQAGVAIDALYRAQYSSLLAYLIRLVSDRATAEDLCHETFLKAFRSWDQQAEVINANAWLRRIATNTAYDYLGRQRRIAFTALPEEATWTAATPMETRWDDAEPVRDALRRMSAHYRVPLVLQSIGGYSLDDIAATLGCSSASAKTRVHRGRKQFRQHYTA